MRLRAKNIFFSLLLVSASHIYSQNPKYEYYHTKAEDAKNNDFVTAKLYADSALNLALDLNDHTLIARGYNELCTIYSSHSKNRECKDFLEKADVHVKQSDNKYVQASVLNNWGIYYERTGNYAK